MARSRPNNPTNGSSSSNPVSSPTLSCPRGDKKCGEKALLRTFEELKAACDEVGGPDCSACKKEAKQIVDAMVKAWNYNHGKGNNISKDSVGGYLCWDWSKAFAEAANSVKAKHWSIKEGMVHKNGSNVVHFFTKLEVKGASGSKGIRYIDDGWFDGKFIHDHPWPPSANWTPNTTRPPSNKYSKPPIKGKP